MQIAMTGSPVCKQRNHMWSSVAVLCCPPSATLNSLHSTLKRDHRTRIQQIPSDIDSARDRAVFAGRARISIVRDWWCAVAARETYVAHHEWDVLVWVVSAALAGTTYVRCSRSQEINEAEAERTSAARRERVFEPEVCKHIKAHDGRPGLVFSVSLKRTQDLAPRNLWICAR